MVLLIGIAVCIIILIMGNSKGKCKVINKDDGIYLWAKISLVVGVIAYIFMWIIALIG